MPLSAGFTASLSLNNANYILFTPPAPHIHKTSRHFQRSVYIALKSIWESVNSHHGTSVALSAAASLLCQLYCETLLGVSTAAAVRGAFWENKDDGCQFSQSIYSWGPQVELVLVKRMVPKPASCHLPLKQCSSVLRLTVSFFTSSWNERSSLCAKIQAEEAWQREETATQVQAAQCRKHGVLLEIQEPLISDALNLK